MSRGAALCESLSQGGWAELGKVVQEHFALLWKGCAKSMESPILMCHSSCFQLPAAFFFFMSRLSRAQRAYY